jgi:beta-lactamase superfamily II metal-dependent hydrolase
MAAKTKKASKVKAARKSKKATTRPARKVKTAAARPAPTTNKPGAQPSAGGDSAWTPAGNEAGIRVRMYRVGFGDFFLVSFLADSGDPVHVIIDCGVFKGTSQTGDIGSIEAAVADMAQTTNGQVALIIVTHRHADHIAGFARCAPTFKALTVQAIWMSIWESQYSPAVKAQAALTSAAMALQTHFTALGVAATDEQQSARKYMENATGAVGGAASNANALSMIKSGFKGVQPHYYQSGQDPALPPSLVQAGITAKILGPPPIADVQLMQLMDLQKGVGQYLTSSSGADGRAQAPFGRDWEVDPDRFYAPEAFHEWMPDRSGPGTPSRTGAKAARLKMQGVLSQAQPDAALVAASKLNSFLNNQSLVVLFTFKGKNLLFVGDAQAGNWEHWILGTDSPDKRAGGTMAANAQKILTSLDFYKVGHHGSSNATPKSVVGMMSKGSHKFAAMCSTQEGVYGKENLADPSAGTEVPRIPLLSALGSIASLVRSDQIAIQVNGAPIAAADPQPLPASTGEGRFLPGPIWIDCYL